jgi:hypothetical protein
MILTVSTPRLSKLLASLRSEEMQEPSLTQRYFGNHGKKAVAKDAKVAMLRSSLATNIA